MEKGIFSERLNKLMREYGVTRAELNRRCDLPPNLIKYWENTGGTPRIDKLDAIAKFFNVSISYLMGFCDDKGVYLSREELSENKNIKDIEKAIFDTDEKDEKTNGSDKVLSDILQEVIKLNERDRKLVLFFINVLKDRK